MRERKFRELLEEMFGRAYGRSLSRDQRMFKLVNMIVVEVLDVGEEPRVVWDMPCDQMEVPDSRRWGHDHNAPPMLAVWHCGVTESLNREIGNLGVLYVKSEQVLARVVIVIHSDKKPHTCVQGACHLP